MSQLSFDEPAVRDVTHNTIGQFHGPAAGAPETELAAAIAVLPLSGKQRTRYAVAVVTAGDRGLTDHEAHALGIGSSYHVAGTRRKEIVDDNGAELVIDSGARRASPHGRPCAVWTATPALVTYVEKHFDELVEAGA